MTKLFLALNNKRLCSIPERREGMGSKIYHFYAYFNLKKVK